MAGLLDSILGSSGTAGLLGSGTGLLNTPEATSILAGLQNYIVPDWAQPQPDHSLGYNMARALPMAVNLLTPGRMGPNGFMRAPEASVSPSPLGRALALADQPVTLNALKNSLESSGWILDYASESAEGVPKSYYLSRRGDLSGKTQIRISDHELGYKNGERQGTRWSTNVVVNPELSLQDHLAAIENRDYYGGGGGFLEGYPYTEWSGR